MRKVDKTISENSHSPAMISRKSWTIFLWLKAELVKISWFAAMCSRSVSNWIQILLKLHWLAHVVGIRCVKLHTWALWLCLNETRAPRWIHTRCNDFIWFQTMIFAHVILISAKHFSTNPVNAYHNAQDFRKKNE